MDSERVLGDSSLREVSIWTFVHVTRRIVRYPCTYALLSPSACGMCVCKWASTMFDMWSENVVSVQGKYTLCYNFCLFCS